MISSYKKMREYFLPIAALLLSIWIEACNRDVTQTSPLESRVKNSKIIVISRPSGAQIYLNNKNMGIKTPDSLVWLQPGSYKVSLKLNLFPEHSQVFEINDSARINYFYNYALDTTNLGKIKCSTTPPSASIYLNDSLINLTTPAVIKNLLPGSYKIKVALANHRADSTFTDVRGNKTNEISFALEDTSIWVSYTVKNCGFTSNDFTSVAVDIYNVKWFGSQDGSVISFNGKKWNATNFGNYINSINIDSKNNIWVSADGRLEQFSGKWTDLSKFVSSKNISSVVEDMEGTIWVGTDFGLYYYKNGSWGVYIGADETVKLTSPKITALALDAAGRVWIGTNYGISIYNYGRWSGLNLLDQSSLKKIGNCVTDIKFGKDGTVWVAFKEVLDKGYSGGLANYDGNNWNAVSLAAIPTNHIRRIDIDQENNKWISTSNGIIKFFNSDSPKLMNLGNSKIPGSVVMQSVVDKNGDLWVATYGGGIGKLKKKYIP